MAATSHELDLVRIIAGRGSEVVYRDDSMISSLRFHINFLKDDGFLEMNEEGTALVPTEKARLMMDAEAEKNLQTAPKA